MLAYVLALVIAIGSLAMYMAAFFFPELHRKEDFIWSGVGLFYALVLWVCAGRITGGVLLGQMASVALLGWFAWQTLTLRRELTPAEQQTPVPSQNELQSQLKNSPLAGTLQGLPERVTGLFGKGKSETKTPQPPSPTQTPSVPPVSSPSVTVIDATTTQTKSAPAETPLPELVRPNPPDPALVEAAKQSAPSNAPESEATATPIEEIAPDAELAPPAEPTGAGDPEDRKADLEPTDSIEAVPLSPENPPAQT